MGQKLPPSEMELYRRVDEILFYLWDPIGIQPGPDARDQYQGYLPRVFSLLKEAKDTSEIENYLTWVRTERMGLPANPEAEAKIASLLIRYRDQLL